MKKIIIVSIAAAAALLMGCQKNQVQVPEARTVRVSASAEDLTSKVVSSKKGRFTWQANDAIGIWTGSEITKFTLDPEWDGYGYGEFVGEIPAGGKIDASSYAVYPFDDISKATATSCKFNDLSGWGIPKNTIRLYSKVEATEGEGTVANLVFHHCYAYFRFTLNNIRTDGGCIFVESTKMFLPVTTTIDFSGSEPAVNITAFNDWTHVVFPAHTGKIDSFTCLVPISPKTVEGDFKVAVKLYSGENFTGTKFAEHYGWLTSPTFAAGDYYVFPEITYPNEKQADDSGSGVNDGIEEAVVNVQDEGFWN